MMVSLLLLTVQLLAQSPCDGRAIADGAAVVGFSQAEAGTFHHACPRSDVGLSLGGRGIIEQANFYARLRGQLRLDAAFQPIDALEVAIAFEPVMAEQVIQSFRATAVGIGDTSISTTLLAFTTERVALSLFGRSSLPTARDYHNNAWPLSFDGALLSTWAPLDAVRLHGGVMTRMLVTPSRAGVPFGGALAANAGVDLVLFQNLALVLDATGQVFERGAIDHVTFGAGVRAALGDATAELVAAAPVAGDERHLAGAVLRVAWRFY